VFRKILIPLDGSEFSDQILGTVLRLIQSGEVEHVYLFQVIDQHAPYAELEATRDRLLALGKNLSPRRVIIDAIAIRGDPTSEILNAAERLEPSLIAKATHGRSGFSRMIFGSITEQVLRQCPVPLLLVNPKTLASDMSSTSTGFQRLLVPLDGTPVAGQILPVVEALGRSCDAQATLLHVQPLPYPAVPAGAPMGRPWGQHELEEALEHCRAQLEDAGVPVELSVSHGVKAEEIIEAAKGFDLVTMATRGRSGLSRWWFGSVAESVIRQCATPTLVYRAECAA